MITKLEERGRKKADQYWPKKKSYFDNGIRVKLKSEEQCDQDLTKRVFEVSLHGIFVYRKEHVNVNDKIVEQAP